MALAGPLAVLVVFLLDDPESGSSMIPFGQSAAADRQKLLVSSIEDIRSAIKTLNSSMHANVDATSTSGTRCHQT